MTEYRGWAFMAKAIGIVLICTACGIVAGIWATGGW